MEYADRNPAGGDPAVMSFPLVRSANIQGDSLAGFKKPYQQFIFLSIQDIGNFRIALASLAPQIARLDTVWLFNRAYSEASHHGGRGERYLKATWLNFLLTWKGLLKLW